MAGHVDLTLPVWISGPISASPAARREETRPGVAVGLRWRARDAPAGCVLDGCARRRRAGSAFARVECVDERCCVNRDWRALDRRVSLASRGAATYADGRLHACRSNVPAE